jgi:hypothetical protein
MAALSNPIEYASATWENNEESTLPDIVTDPSLPGKYKTAVTTILSKHCTEVKLSSEELNQHLTTISKKKLKELIAKHNNDLFAFMAHPDKTLQHPIGIAETIFRRYGYDIPTIKGSDRHTMLKELNLNMSMDPIVLEFNESLKKLQGEGTLEDFMKQMRWLFQQYRTIGEEVMRLETTLFQKIELLDKLHNRIPIITSLTANDALPELVDAFTNYTDQIYQSSRFEDNYKDLVESYKKWNICRQIVTLQSMMRPDATDPQCSICLLEPVSNALVPCGHTYCTNCARKQNTTCYICRGQIRERIRLFFT